LKKAGYATNPKYTQQLLRYIETYNLQLYSLIALGKKSMQDEAPMYAVNGNVVSPEIAVVPVAPAARKNIKQGVVIAQPAQATRIQYPEGEFRINDTKVVFVLSGNSLLAVAEQYGIKYKHIIDFNELEEV
jgi:hypothetical protein